MMIGLSWFTGGLRKYQKRSFLALSWILDSLVYARKQFKNFKTPTYITITRIRHLLAKFTVDSNDLVQINSLGIWKSRIFWNFSAKSRFFVTSPNDVNFSHFSITEKFPFVARHNHAKFGADSKECLLLYY